MTPKARIAEDKILEQRDDRAPYFHTRPCSRHNGELQIHLTIKRSFTNSASQASESRLYSFSQPVRRPRLEAVLERESR